MKKATHLILFLIVYPMNVWAQADVIRNTVQRSEVEAHLRFLAADELRGRDTGSPEIEIAARYIAETFRRYGLQPVPGNDFFQPVRLVVEKPPLQATLSFAGQTFSLGSDLLVLEGDSIDLQAPVVYANYGLAADLDRVDIKGKIVVVKAGTPEETNPQSFFFSSRDKHAIVEEKGGLALIELYSAQQIPWALLVQYLNTERLTLGEDNADKPTMPLLWLNDPLGGTPQGERLSLFQNKATETGTLSITPQEKKEIPAKNVAAMVEGTDAKLKEEYVILSAHYDHVGVGKSGSSGQDSIFNGARDNAIGVTALLTAAEYFGEHPPKRSLLLLALTAEEKGLLGSAWYAEHPLVPLKQTVFNLNTDGAGYNDTTKVTVIGLERTTAAEALAAASGALGLEAVRDPVPEQNLYDRSDNVSFATKGIPAVDFAPGITAFDQEIMKNYHQVTDEVSTLHFNYLERFCEAYILAAQKIATMAKKPFWKPGDKYEQAGQALYGK